MREPSETPVNVVSEVAVLRKLQAAEKASQETAAQIRQTIEARSLVFGVLLAAAVAAAVAHDAVQNARIDRLESIVEEAVRP